MIHWLSLPRCGLHWHLVIVRSRLLLLGCKLPPCKRTRQCDHVAKWLPFTSTCQAEVVCRFDVDFHCFVVFSFGASAHRRGVLPRLQRSSIFVLRSDQRRAFFGGRAFQACEGVGGLGPSLHSYARGFRLTSFHVFQRTDFFTHRQTEGSMFRSAMLSSEVEASPCMRF